MQVDSRVTSEINMSEAGTDLRDRGPPINALVTGEDRRRHPRLLDGSMSENRVGEARTDIGDRSRSRGVLPSLDAALACACNSHICFFLCALLITMGGSLAVTFSMPSPSKLQSRVLCSPTEVCTGFDCNWGHTVEVADSTRIPFGSAHYTTAVCTSCRCRPTEWPVPTCAPIVVYTRASC